MALAGGQLGPSKGAQHGAGSGAGLAALNVAIALFSHDATTRAIRAPGRACQPRTSAANSARCCAVGRALLEASAIAARASGVMLSTLIICGLRAPIWRGGRQSRRKRR
jgi:hypothetical protein